MDNGIGRDSGGCSTSGNLEHRIERWESGSVHRRWMGEELLDEEGLRVDVDLEH